MVNEIVVPSDTIIESVVSEVVNETKQHMYGDHSGEQCARCKRLSMLTDGEGERAMDKLIKAILTDIHPFVMIADEDLPIRLLAMFDFGVMSERRRVAAASFDHFMKEEPVGANTVQAEDTPVSLLGL